MRQCLAAILAVGLLAGAVGCGGLSQEDMKRRAIHRPDSDAIVPGPQRQNASTTSNSPPATPETQSAGPQDAGQRARSQSTEVTVAATAAGAQAETTVGGPPTSAEPVEDTTQVAAPPERPRPVTPVERRARTIENLTRIGAAMTAYVADHGCYPAPSIYDLSGTPVLSWRVELLPYLGYESLYKHFHLDEPWNSPRNAALLKNIPEVYQSPERDDTSTNYLVPVGSGTMFPGRRGKTPAQIEDGPKNTVAVLEVDNGLAVQWTRPAEYNYQPNSPRAGLGGLRADGFFVVWGDGQVTSIPASLSVQQLWPMYTADAGEPFTPAQISRPATAELASGPDAPVFASVSTSATTSASHAASSAIGDETKPPQLQGQFATEARAALEEGRERDAARWYHAMALTAGADDEFWRYYVRWAPQLGRPLLALRFAIGVRYYAPNEGKESPDPIGQARIGTARTSQTGSKPLGYYTGELGDSVVEALSQRAAEGRLGALLQDASVIENATQTSRGPTSGRALLSGSANATPAGGIRSAARMRPGIYYLGDGSTKVLNYLADREDIDAVVYFDVHVKSVGKGKTSTTTSITIVDRTSGVQIARTPQLNNLQVERLRQNPTDDDPVLVMMSRLQERIDAAIELEPLPAAFDEQHVRDRIDWITSRRHEYPLPALMELRLYYLRGSLDRDELATHYRSIVGDEAARQLVFGSASDQALALEPWLPDAN